MNTEPTKRRRAAAPTTEEKVVVSVQRKEKFQGDTRPIYKKWHAQFEKLNGYELPPPDTQAAGTRIGVPFEPDEHGVPGIPEQMIAYLKRDRPRETPDTPVWKEDGVFILYDVGNNDALREAARQIERAKGKRATPAAAEKPVGKMLPAKGFTEKAAGPAAELGILAKQILTPGGRKASLVDVNRHKKNMPQP